jgi:hypothetical protein
VVAAGYPALAHPSGVVFAVDLGDALAVLQLAGLVVTWRELDPAAHPPEELSRAVRAAFRQASRMS